MTDRKQAAALAKIEHYRDELRVHEKAAEKSRKALHSWITKAVTAGVRSAEVARVAGVSKARVSQLAPLNPVVETRIHAQKDDAPASCVQSADTVPALPDTSGGTLAGVASQRRRDRYGRLTMFMDSRDVTELRTILDTAHAQGAGRVILAGPAPFDVSGGATKPEAVRAWALSEVEGWTAGDHYLVNPDLPLLRFKHTATGDRVTVLRGAMWWGETDADGATCRAAWEGLERALDAVPAFKGAGLADTPATTGRALWLRTIPEGKSYPVLSDELRELLHATSGQGRVELLSERHPGRSGTAADFTVMDGRLMYAALTWGMPVGEPVMWTGDELRRLDAREYERTMRGRGRWRITATVPATWDHVGMLMAPCSGTAKWCYPSRPGETFTTWADGSEVWAALAQGWQVETHEGMTWAEGKPLDTWRDALVSVWKQANASDAAPARLAAKAVRSLILFTIGAFATTAHPITKTVPLDQAGIVPAGAEVRVVGDRLMWDEPGRLSAWSMETAHPEWSATVWARARARLLSARGVSGQPVGALHLERSRIVSFATDAIYLAGNAPDWADDGEPGRFRLKGTRPGLFAWPSTPAELHELRDEAEGN